MKASKIFRYLLAFILLMQFYPLYAQDETKFMRMYFNTYKQTGGTPTFTLNGDVPDGVTASAEGFVWAQSYEIFWQRQCQDRIFAQKSSDERSTNASISFNNMKYEVKEVRWNRMNDIFDNSILETFRSLRAFGTVESFTGTKIQGSEATWMVLNKDFTFQKDIFPPNKSNNLALPGLRTITLNESNSTIIFGSSRKINDNCRFFLKASDDTGSNDWAFQVTYYEPSISSFNIPTMMLVDEEHDIKIGDFSIAHPGAFNFTVKSYESNTRGVISIDDNGKMKAESVGSAVITITLSDGNKEITASKTVTVGTLTPQTGVLYYHDENSHSSIDFSQLKHEDNDYQFSTSTQSTNGSKVLGVLTSKSDKNYKVGAAVVDFEMSAPAYTTVTSPLAFSIKNEVNGVGANQTSNYGGEVIVTDKDYNNIILQTDGTPSEDSFYKDWKGSQIHNANNSILINNENGENSIDNQKFHIILLSAGNKTQYDKKYTTTFTYQVVPSVTTYYAYITFDGNGGTITGTNQQTIAQVFNTSTSSVNTESLQNIEWSAPTGYKNLIGWNTRADGTGEHYDVNGAFRPSTTLTGGEGKGHVTLYAEWEAKTYNVALSPNANDVTLPGASEVGKSVVVYATYNEPMPSVTKNGNELVVPYRTGYRFEGFFTGKTDGTMYYDENMQSVRNWDIDRNDQFIYLYAHWTRTYTVTLDHNDGTGISEQVTVVNGEAMPSETTTGDAILTPERRGYIFDGYYERNEYYNRGNKYYNADLTSEHSWDKSRSATIYALWEMKPYTIIYHSNDSKNETSSQEISNQYIGVNASFNREGYILSGWSYTSTGNVVFHQGEIIPSDDINISEPDRVLHLYAQWDLKSLNVTFNYTDPSKNIMAPARVLGGYKLSTSNNSSLSGTIIETPTYDEYIFDGWYEQDGRNKAYDAAGNAVEGVYWKKNTNGSLVWDYHTDVNLYPQWIKDATFVDVKIIRDNNYEGDVTHNYVGVTVSGMTTVSNFRGKGYITVDGVNYLSWHKNGNQDNLLSVPLSDAPVWNIDAVDGYENKVLIYTDTPEGRKYLGNKIENGQVTEDAIGIEEHQPAFYFTIYNERGWICLDDKEGHMFNHILYMKEGDVWEYENTGDNPQYKPIRILAYGTSTSYGNLNSSKVVGEIKKKLSTPDANGRYPYAYNGKIDAELCKGILYVDMGGASDIIEANATDLSTFKGEVSQNCLFFMPKTYNNTLGTNVVTNMGDKYVSADDLVITDKVPFSSPYTFSTGSHTASYSRETSDKWGSMCLPFPVKRMGSDMKFYKLYGSDDLRLAFESVDGDIPANKPIACYGSGNFTLTSNSNVEVPADNVSREYNETVSAISCENIRELVEDKKQMTTENKTWNFKGVRFCSYVYGTENTETPLPNRAIKSLVYYFSNDKFTYVNSKGRVKFAPFRAYLQAPEGSSAKTFSLLVFDEDGATDITDIIDGNAGVANGKIYDLLGRRVKTPLKGHIYIVDGKKKQY